MVFCFYHTTGSEIPKAKNRKALHTGSAVTGPGQFALSARARTVRRTGKSGKVLDVADTVIVFQVGVDFRQDEDAEG